MKANELMIGDWVTTPNGIARVIMIGEHSPCYTNKTGEGEAAIFPRNLQPIPITPEIFEKNGQPGIAKYYKYCFRDKSRVLYLEPWSDGEYGLFTDLATEVPFVKIRYVHELQHALRLCGIEKEITL